MREHLKPVHTPAFLSMQHGRCVVVTRLEILFFNNLETQFRFDALQDHALIDALSNRSVTARTVVFVHAKWVCCFPESIIIKCLKPFFKVFTVFKVLHVLIVSQCGVASPEQSSKASTCKCNGTGAVVSERLVL